MKLPKLLKKPIAKLKRAVGRTPKQTERRSFLVSHSYKNVKGGDALEDRRQTINSNIQKNGKTAKGRLRALDRVDRITKKRSDAMLPEHRVKRLEKHQQLRQKKTKRKIGRAHV